MVRTGGLCVAKGGRREMSSGQQTGMSGSRGWVRGGETAGHTGSVFQIGACLAQGVWSRPS